MDPSLQRIFQDQVLFQFECAMRAAQQIDDGLKARDVSHVFCGVQNLLSAAATAARALWGQTNDAAVAKARAPLRAGIGVADDSPLRSVRMRNNFEHIDERIDHWWRTDPDHIYFDMNIMPAMTIDNVAHTSMLRSFDPQTGHVTFWGQSFDLKALLTEIQRLLPKLQAGASKPRFGS